MFQTSEFLCVSVVVKGSGACIGSDAAVFGVNGRG